MNVYVYDPYVEKEKVKISGAIPVDNISENLQKMDAVTLIVQRITKLQIYSQNKNLIL